MSPHLLHDALKFAGLLLAQQAGVADTGEIPPPLAVISSDSENSPIFLEPTTDSQSLVRQIAGGKIVLSGQKGRLRTWAFSFDEELDPFRILMLEVGCKGVEDFYLVQRYIHPENGKFQLIGQVDLLALEKLDSTVARELESCAWRELMEAGAERNAEFGEKWRQWRSDMRSIDQGERYLIGDHEFVCPSGWVPSKTQDGNGWMFYRLLPWDARENEPAVICNFAAWEGAHTVQEVIWHLTSLDPEDDYEIMASGLFELEPGLSVGRVLKQFATGELLEQTVVPTANKGQFLMVSAVSLSEFWAETKRAHDMVLGSFEPREVRHDRKGSGAAIKNLMRRFLGRS